MLIEWVNQKADRDQSAVYLAEMMSRPDWKITIDPKDVRYLMDHHDAIFMAQSKYDKNGETRCLPPLQRDTIRMEHEFAELIRVQYVDN